MAPRRALRGPPADIVDEACSRELVETGGPGLAELFVYPGDRHLFTDNSLPSFVPDASALAVRRSREFLDRVS